MSRSFHVYILASHSRTLYIGVTSDLEYRLAQHRSGCDQASFTARYSATRLVRYEKYPTAADAIAREKQIKGWTRAKKIALIESENKHWTDLADRW